MAPPRENAYNLGVCPSKALKEDQEKIQVVTSLFTLKVHHVKVSRTSVNLCRSIINKINKGGHKKNKKITFAKHNMDFAQATLSGRA